MNIAAYCRVSTDKEDQLNSLDAQKRFFTEFTEKNGHTLVRLYADEGISGTKIKNRKEFLRLLKDAESGLFDMVVVKDISRFARNTVDLLQSTRKLKALGIETTFLTANMTVLGNSEFVLTIFGALAQEESANTSKRVKFGKKLNAEKGRVPNIVYGYDKTIGDYFNLEINAQEADVVQQIYQWYLKEGYGAAKIAKMLNEKGLRTKRDCIWSQNAVCRILTNELYTGKIINGKQEVTDFLTGQRAEKDKTDWLVTEHPDLRIIEPEQYEQAVQLMEQRGKTFHVERERQSNKYLFSTLIKCKECGWSFRRTVRTYKNTYIRWVCSGHNGQGADSCPNRIAVDEDELIAALQAYFAEVLQSKKNIIHYVVGEFNRLYKAKSDNVEYEKELRQKLSKLNKTRQKYMDMYADDLITRQELNDRIGGMKEEIARIENDLKLVSFNIDKGEQLEGIIKKTFDTIESITDVRQLTNAQLKQVIQKIEVDQEGNVDIYLRLLGDLGLDETVLISDNRTQGPVGASAAVRPHALHAGKGHPGREQVPAPHPGRPGHPPQVQGRVKASTPSPGCLLLSISVVGAVTPLQLLLQLELQLLVLLHQRIVMHTLHIILHEVERGLVELLLGVLRQQRTALAAQAGHADNHQTAVLLRQLEQLQRLRDLQLQVVALVDDLQQAALLRLGGDDNAVLGEQPLQIAGGDLLAGDRALADAGEHGVGQVQAHVDFAAGLRILHGRTSCVFAPPGGRILFVLLPYHICRRIATTTCEKCALFIRKNGPFPRNRPFLLCQMYQTT